MKVNSNLLKGYALINNETLSDLAKALKLEKSSIYKKINGNLRFSQNEITFIKDRYNLSDDIINSIFKED